MGLRAISIIMGLLIFASACKQPMKINTRTVSKYNAADFGELPLLSGGVEADVDQLIPMISDDGKFSEGVLTTDTKIVVGVENGKDKECTLPKGLTIKLSVFLQTKSAQQLFVINLSQPCKTTGAGTGDELVEGYVPLKDIQITINLGGLEVNGSTPGATPPLVTDPDPNNPVATATPNPAATATPTPDPKPTTTYLGCTSVRQGTEEDLASKLDGCTSGNSKCALPGKKFRDAATEVSLAVGGSAHKWKISIAPSSDAAVGKDPISTIEPKEYLNSSLVKVSDSVVLIPVDGIIGKNNWTRRDAIIGIQGVNEKGENVGTQCVHTIAIVSPIALDLSGKDNRKTLEPSVSKVKFDHNHDGKKERSGWILPHMGLLVWDQNKNGQVDGGHELFGEFTNGKGKKTFENGYKALATLDTDKNGYIDAKDKQFAELKVWVDMNSDAMVQKGELKTLAEHTITRIDTTYTNVSHNPKGFTNKIKYASKFYGPKNCPKSGCMSYDIYFGTNTSSAMR